MWQQYHQRFCWQLQDAVPNSFHFRLFVVARTKGEAMAECAKAHFCNPGAFDRHSDVHEERRFPFVFRRRFER